MADLTMARATLRLEIARGFNDAYITHQLVADLFGDRDDRGYLYRVVSRAPREARVLILSPEEAQPGPPREWGHTIDLETRPFDPVLVPGQLLDYEIRINATRVVTLDSGQKKRMDIWDHIFDRDSGTSTTPHEVYKAYLARKLDGAAKVEGCRVVERGMTKVARRGRGPIPFVATNLIGTLQVTDPSCLLDEIGKGLGRAKAFGCGLLCLSRPGSVLPRRYAGLTAGL